MMKHIALSSLPFLLSGAPVSAATGNSRYLQDQNCTTIERVVCGGEYPTESLCQAFQIAGLDESFLANNLNSDTWTLFAPTDEAFDALSIGAITRLISGAAYVNQKYLVDLLSYHIVPDLALESTDLKCDGNIVMANDETTATICEGADVFQVGIGNSMEAYPEIIEADIETCNGFVHLISEVML